MSRLAIITARGGSKRIPKKISEILWKTDSGIFHRGGIVQQTFDHVMVSTDDTEIAEIAKSTVQRCRFPQ